MDYRLLEVCRSGGINEVVAVVLLAAKFGVFVCPPADGVVTGRAPVLRT